MTIRAIPTTWNGVNFRSRLEARWAAMFTRLDWDWHYEPLDLAGYIPDFVVQMQRPVLFEVKPFMCVDDAQVAEAHRKISESGWKEESVVVGARLFWSGKCHNTLAIGLLSSPRELATVGRCLECQQLSFSSEDESRHCRLCGAIQECGCSVCHDGTDDRNFAPLAQEIWREAGNAVQWRRKA